MDPIIARNCLALQNEIPKPSQNHTRSVTAPFSRIVELCSARYARKAVRQKKRMRVSTLNCASGSHLVRLSTKKSATNPTTLSMMRRK